MDQGGGLKRLTRRHAAQFLDGEVAEFVVDQGQELLGGLRVSLLDGREDLRHIIHATESPLPRPSLGPSCTARVTSQPDRGAGGLPQFNCHASEGIE